MMIGIGVLLTMVAVTWALGGFPNIVAHLVFAAPSFRGIGAEILVALRMQRRWRLAAVSEPNVTIDAG